MFKKTKTKKHFLHQLTRVRVGGLQGLARQTDPGKRLAEWPTGWQAGAALAALTEQRQVRKGLGGVSLGPPRLRDRDQFPPSLGPRTWTLEAQEGRDFKPDSGLGPSSQEGVQDLKKKKKKGKKKKVSPKAKAQGQMASQVNSIKYLEKR